MRFPALSCLKFLAQAFGPGGKLLCAELSWPLEAAI